MVSAPLIVLDTVRLKPAQASSVPARSWLEDRLEDRAEAEMEGFSRAELDRLLTSLVWVVSKSIGADRSFGQLYSYLYIQ